MDLTGSPRISLRERKRITAMHRIQTVALELFEREGFDNVTVERIAELAEVSPSSIYRWFGSKERLVIWDEYDPTALAAIEEGLTTAPPLEALREVVRMTMGGAFADDAERMRRRLRIAFSNPGVEAASTLETYEMATAIAAVIAGARGDDVHDLDVQVAAHAFVGALLGALRHWHDTDFTTPVEDVIEQPLLLLDRGARLR
jgi:AcrR family transcriptional regulator